MARSSSPWLQGTEVHTEVVPFPLEKANEALRALRSSKIRGAAVCWSSAEKPKSDGWRAVEMEVSLYLVRREGIDNRGRSHSGIRPRLLLC